MKTRNLHWTIQFPIGPNVQDSDRSMIVTGQRYYSRMQQDRVPSPSPASVYTNHFRGRGSGVIQIEGISICLDCNLLPTEYSVMNNSGKNRIVNKIKSNKNNREKKKKGVIPSGELYLRNQVESPASV